MKKKKREISKEEKELRKIFKEMQRYKKPEPYSIILGAEGIKSFNKAFREAFENVVMFGTPTIMKKRKEP